MFAGFALAITALAAIVCRVHGNGHFVVLHTSPNYELHDDEKPIDQSSLKEILFSSLGYTVSQEPDWHGLQIKSHYYPEALVAVALKGVDDLGELKNDKLFPLKTPVDEEIMWQGLTNLIRTRASETSKKNNTPVRLNLEDGIDKLGQSALGELKTLPIDKQASKPLSMDKYEDRKFLEEVQLLKAIAVKVRSVTSSDNYSDVYWFVVSNLGKIFDTYGKESPAATKAVDLLNEALHELNGAFKEALKDQVLITAFSSNPSEGLDTHSAKARSKRDAGNDKPLTAKDINALPNQDDDEDFPVIFNICLWFVVAFFFSLLAICIFIAEMDPGRDSIIYRMTSNRMKKDN